MQKFIISLSIALGLIFSSCASFANTTGININKLTKTFVSETQGLRPKVVKTALTAYQDARNRGIRDTKGIITIIDYSMPSTAKRLWVLDINMQKVLYNTWVAHGKNNGVNYPTTFSNQSKSLESSIGLYETANAYIGHDGLSLRLKGLDKGFNNNAMKRGIVMHGAWYVGQNIINAYGRIGRSWGCPAVTKKLATPIIDTIKNGTLVLAYYPNKNWLDHSIYLRPATAISPKFKKCSR